MDEEVLRKYIKNALMAMTNWEDFVPSEELSTISYDQAKENVVNRFMESLVSKLRVL